MATKGIKGFDIKGLKEVYKELKITADEIEKAAFQGVRGLAEEIKTESQNRVPIDSHTLQETADVDYDYANKIATVFYNTPYALKQHEDASLDHSESQRIHGQGEAKYLERPFNERSQELEKYVSEWVYKTLRKKYPS